MGWSFLLSLFYGAKTVDLMSFSRAPVQYLVPATAAPAELTFEDSSFSGPEMRARLQLTPFSVHEILIRLPRGRGGASDLRGHLPYRLLL